MQVTYSTSGLILTALIAYTAISLMPPDRAAFGADHVLASPDAASEKPADSKKVDEIKWGEEVDGLQAGIAIRSTPKDVHHVGDTIQFTIKVRNVGKQPVAVSYVDSIFATNPPIVRNGAGEQVRVYMPMSPRSLALLKEQMLSPGQILEWGKAEGGFPSNPKLVPSLTLVAANVKQPDEKGATVAITPGTYSVVYGGFIQSAPLLATPELKFEVRK